MTRILVYTASTLSSVNPLVGGVGLGEGEGLSSESVSIDRVTHLAISSALLERPLQKQKPPDGNEPGSEILRNL